MKALSIRQPWAWLITRPDLTTPAERAAAIEAHGIKPVENRTWEMLYRGPLLIHAGQALTRGDYEACVLFLQSDARLRPLLHVLPARGALQLGGIVGQADVVACVRAHESPFFNGPFGVVLHNAKPREFVPLKGALGLFNVQGVYPI